MKISKSKKELARIISENGGWRDGANYASQHGCHGGIGFSLAKPERCGDTGWDAGGSFIAKIEYKKPIKNWHQAILSRAEYFHLYPAHDAKPRFCESVMRSIPEPEYKPSIEQLMEIYTDRSHSLQLAKEHLATCSKQASEAMDALSVACKAAGFDISPITAKQEPELVIADWRELLPDDVIKVHSFGSVYSECTVLALEGNDVFVRNHAGRKYRPDIKNNHWRFIRRP